METLPALPPDQLSRWGMAAADSKITQQCQDSYIIKNVHYLHLLDQLLVVPVLLELVDRLELGLGLGLRLHYLLQSLRGWLVLKKHVLKVSKQFQAVSVAVTSPR